MERTVPHGTWTVDPGGALPGRFPAGPGGAGSHPAAAGEDLPHSGLLPVAAGPAAAGAPPGAAGHGAGPAPAPPERRRGDRLPPGFAGAAGERLRPGNQRRRKGDPSRRRRAPGGDHLPGSPRTGGLLGAGALLGVAGRRGGEPGLAGAVLPSVLPGAPADQSAPSAGGPAGAGPAVPPASPGPVVQPRRLHPHAGGAVPPGHPAAPAGLCDPGGGGGTGAHPPPRAHPLPAAGYPL